MTYRLSNEARNDLREIYTYSYDNFGVHQADNYYDGLLSCFELLSDNPHMGRAFNEVIQGLRRHEHESHVIYYEIEEDMNVLILRILGANQDPARHL